MEARTPEEIAHDNLTILMTDAFETGKILNAPEEALQKYLWHLCTAGIENEIVRHRAIIRALTINHIQMQRHIDKLNKRSTFLTWVVIILAIANLAAMGYQIYQGRSFPSLPQQTEPPSKAKYQLVPTSKPSSSPIKVISPSKTTPPQATFQTPHQDNTISAGTPSESTYKGQVESTDKAQEATPAPSDAKKK